MAKDWFMKIDGVIMPNPKECPITEFNIDGANAGRSENGYMGRDVIRTNVGSYDPVWQDLTDAEANMIRNAIMPVSFTVEIKFLGGTIARRMSAGDRRWTTKIANGKGHNDLSVQFTEV